MYLKYLNSQPPPAILYCLSIYHHPISTPSSRILSRTCRKLRVGRGSRIAALHPARRLTLVAVTRHTPLLYHSHLPRPSPTPTPSTKQPTYQPTSLAPSRNPPRSSTPRLTAVPQYTGTRTTRDESEEDEPIAQTHRQRRHAISDFGAIAWLSLPTPSDTGPVASHEMLVEFGSWQGRI